MDNSAQAPSGGAKTEPPTGSRHRHVLLLGSLAAIIVILDLVTKLLVVANLTPGTPVRILGGLIYLSLYRNSGAAFSMATGMTWVLTLVVIAVIIVIIRMATRLKSTAWAICLGLVLGGAVGNLIDRLFRAPGFLRGHVVDFVSVFAPDGKYFAIFNVADSAITCGGIALVITALFGIDFDGRRSRGKDKKEPVAVESAAADVSRGGGGPAPAGSTPAGPPTAGAADSSPAGAGPAPDNGSGGSATSDNGDDHV